MIQHNKPTVEPDDIEEVSKVLDSGWIVQGKKVDEFEKAVCDYLGIDGQGIAVSSGTAALYLALFSLGIGKGDKVILPTYVCSALLNAIFFTGAIPILVDVNLNDFNISFEKTRKKIEGKTKAIIVPHIYGTPADIDKFIKLEIPIIEDCAQSIGARKGDQMVGTFGDISVFSFYATKMLTTGQGGMIVSRAPEIIGKIKDFREFDYRREYKVRFNLQMTDMQAALGLSQLRKLPNFIESRRTIAKRYTEVLSRSGRNLMLQEVSDNKKSVYYRFVMRSKNGIERIRKLFQENGIQTIVPVETFELLHKYLKLNGDDFKNSEELAKTTLSVPIYPTLKEAEISKIMRIMGKI